jgi:hypothetical protein
MAMDAAGELLAALYQLVESKAGKPGLEKSVKSRSRSREPIARPRAKQLPRALRA